MDLSLCKFLLQVSVKIIVMMHTHVSEVCDAQSNQQISYIRMSF